MSYRFQYLARRYKSWCSVSTERNFGFSHNQRPEDARHIRAIRSKTPTRGNAVQRLKILDRKCRAPIAQQPYESMTLPLRQEVSVEALPRLVTWIRNSHALKYLISQGNGKHTMKNHHTKVWRYLFDVNCQWRYSQCAPTRASLIGTGAPAGESAPHGPYHGRLWAKTAVTLGLPGRLVPT